MFCAALVFAASGVGAYADVDVADLIHIEDASGTASSSAGRYDRRTGEIAYTASLKNVTNSAIQGPFYVTVGNVTAPGVFDINHDAQLSDGRGVYRLEGTLDPDEIAKKELFFRNPDRLNFRFDVDIWVLASANPQMN
jgi:hypothetical protein